MARQTRAQRKARRREQAEAAGTAPAQRAGRQPVRPAAPEKRAAAAPAPRRVPGFGGFVSESVGELKKVEWPGQKQVVTGTVAVLIACAIVGTYLWVADLVLKRFVQHVFLGQ